MNFYPKGYERYAAALRSNLQKRILRDGYSLKYHTLLKKVYIFESIVLKNINTVPVDTVAFFDALFGAVFLKLAANGVSVSTAISVRGTICINIKILKILLGMLCALAEKGNAVFFACNRMKNAIRILVTGVEITQEIKKITALADGVFLIETIGKKSAFFIPCKNTSKEAVYTPNEYDFLIDELSVFEIFSKDY